MYLTMKMGFCEIRHMVVCVLLMIVVSHAQRQPIQGSNSLAFADASCNVERLESRLTSMEDQLNRLLRIVPSIKENCTVELASYGYDDSTKHGYVRTNGGSSEDTYAVGNLESYRGVTLFELDATTCTTKKRRQFDTYSSAYVSMQLVETLESIMTGTIIVGVAADSAEHQSIHFRNSANVFFTSYYMSLSEVGFRDKFAFVMQKGYPQKTLFQRKPRYGESLRMTVALRGSSVYDVSFNQV